MKIILSLKRETLQYSTKEIFQRGDDSLMLSTEGLEGGRCMLKTSAIRDDNNRFLFTYAHCLNCVLLQGVWAPFKCKYFTREYHMGDTAVCFY